MGKLLIVVGLVANAVGVIVLFRYGMPYRTRRGEASYLLLEGDEGTDTEDLRQEERFNVLGWVGLFLIVVGTGLQIAGTLGHG
jgi:hypothetical protein